MCLIGKPSLHFCLINPPSRHTGEIVYDAEGKILKFETGVIFGGSVKIAALADPGTE